MKKEVSWNQGGRNGKLIGRATADKLEIDEAIPLQDKKWQGEFIKNFKKDIKHKRKVSPQRIGEIKCTQADIGEPNPPKLKKSKV